jgi:hypothetical protein
MNINIVIYFVFIGGFLSMVTSGSADPKGSGFLRKGE